MSAHDQLDAEDRRLDARIAESTARGGHAFARLLALAETRDSGQVRTIARFIASTYNGIAFPFDLFKLCGLDEAIGDDMLACLDALRWGRADLYRLVPDGDARVKRVLHNWNIEWPAAE
ncbi:hypothetical protein BH11PSE8_BH11PSE8_24400 [soil metagenome]